MKLQNIFYSTIVLLMYSLLAGCSSTVEQQAAPILLFPDRHGWDLAKVSISDTETTLDFKRVNCVWVIGDDNRPSDEPRVTALAEKLVTMVPQGPIAIEPQRYNDFKIGDRNFSRKVTLTFKDNSSYTMLIGAPAITKPAYLRFVDRSQVYRVDEPVLRQINLDGDSWLALPDEG
jgi:hypothetical protein